MRHFYTTFYETDTFVNDTMSFDYRGTTLCGLKNMPWTWAYKKENDEFALFLTRDQIRLLKSSSRQAIFCQECINHPKVLLLLLSQNF